MAKERSGLVEKKCDTCGKIQRVQPGVGACYYDCAGSLIVVVASSESLAKSTKGRYHRDISSETQSIWR